METVSLQQSLKIRRAELSANAYKDNFQRIFKIFVIFAAAVFLAGVIMFILQGFLISKYNFSRVSVANAASPIPSAISQMTEINIANNGLVFVRGAVVTAVSDKTIQAKVSWGFADFSWAVQTSETTKFFDHKGGVQTISDIKVGDIVAVTGKLVNNSNKFTINAEFVRE